MECSANAQLNNTARFAVHPESARTEKERDGIEEQNTRAAVTVRLPYTRKNALNRQTTRRARGGHIQRDGNGVQTYTPL